MNLTKRLPSTMPPAPTNNPITTKIQSAIASLNASFLERADVTEALYDAAIAGLNIFLYGPPGTAKSALIRAFSSQIDAKYYEYLLTRFTEPNEIFGPVDLTTYKSGRYQRVVTDQFPEAEVAFLDEIFKANSAILNSLLLALNERVYQNPSPMPIPLHMCAAASNEIPEDSSLNALLDRFQIRVKVDPIKEVSNRETLLFGKLPPPTVQVITLGELKTLRDKAKTLSFTTSAITDMRNVWNELKGKNIVVSDRRWVQAALYLQAHAARNNAPAVDSEHIGALKHVLWTRPEEIVVVEQIVTQYVAQWLQQVRHINKSIDELASTLKNLPPPESHDRFSAFAEIIHKHDNLKKSADALPDRPECNSVRERLKQLKADAVKASRE